MKPAAVRSDEFVQKLRDWKPRSTAIRSHLARWIEDDRATSVWQAVTKHAGGNLGPEEFIRRVAWTAMAARGLRHRLDSHNARTAMMIAAQKARVAAAFASMKSPAQVAAVLEEAAWQLRTSEEISMLREYPVGTISRKQAGETQKRRAFSLMISDFLKERCDLWMDEQVGVLLEIAFGERSGDSQEEARSYRKSRRKKVGH